MRIRWRAGIATMAALAVLGTLGYVWQDSLVPATYSVMDMGYPDAGGQPAAPGHQHGGIGVDTLTGPKDTAADVSVVLTARKQRFTLAGLPEVDGYTFNGSSPGPQLTAVQGDLVEVRLVNESVPAGVTLHWHGVDVPNAEDGVAGVTQDAVGVGAEHVYRFIAADAGTYWYHSHQVSHEQVRLGLWGTLVVSPAADAAPRAGVDTVLAVHTYGGRRTVGGQQGLTAIQAAAGTVARIRVLNTDQGPIRGWVTGAPYTVVAVDGRDVNAPTPVTDAAVLITAGGRIDVQLTVPPGGVRVDVGAGAALAIGGAPAPVAEPRSTVDLLSYGAPAELGLDPAAADRRFEYRIGRRPGFLDGVPGLWWTINGRLWPDVPMYLVDNGDVVRMTIANTSGEVHPMHLHGHHAVVLSRNGVPATGSPWWIDSLDVADNETYEIAFRADNPGIWVDHCHNLPHAAEGLLAHLAYTGFTTPYRVGGDAGNHPE